MTDLPAKGYPLDLRVPYSVDGPLVIDDPRGARLEFTVKNGLVSASTRERAIALVGFAGATLPAPDQAAVDAAAAAENTPPAGSGDQPPAGGAKRSSRSPAPSTDPEG